MTMGLSRQMRRIWLSSATAAGLLAGSGLWGGIEAARAQFTAVNSVSGTSDGATAGPDAVAVGPNAAAGGEGSTAVGDQSQATQLLSTALGGESNATGERSTALGAESTASGTMSVALGNASAAGGFDSTALGTFSNAGGDGSIAIGHDTFSAGNGSTALGYHTSASGLNSTALGQNSSAGFANSTAIGSGAVTTRDNQMMLGTASNTYTASGIASAESRAAQQGPVEIVTSDASGNLATTDASSLGLATIDDFEQAQQGIERNTEGIAMAMALGGVPNILPCGTDYAVSANWGTFDSENAIALGGTARLVDNVFINAGGAFGTSGRNNSAGGGRAGVTYAW